MHQIQNVRLLVVAELMRANEKYVQNHENNVGTKFCEYWSNFVPVKAFYALADTMELAKHAMKPITLKQQLSFYTLKGIDLGV